MAFAEADQNRYFPETRNTSNAVFKQTRRGGIIISSTFSNHTKSHRALTFEAGFKAGWFHSHHYSFTSMTDMSAPATARWRDVRYGAMACL